MTKQSYHVCLEYDSLLIAIDSNYCENRYPHRTRCADWERLAIIQAIYTSPTPPCPVEGGRRYLHRSLHEPSS
jgi:hypothetical protein